MRLFGEDRQIDLHKFNVSRVDVKADIEDLPVEVALSRVFAMGFKSGNYSIYKGSTIYIGSNPRIVIYDKTKEILYRLRKRKKITEQEAKLLEKEKKITRFEIRIANPGLSLHDVVFNPESLVKHFDRLAFYDFEDSLLIASSGGLQLLFSKIPRKHRKLFETFKSDRIKELIKEDYLRSVKVWFDGPGGGADEDIPF